MKEQFKRKFNEKYLKRALSIDRTEVKSKEVIISYKTIYRNTYDILVIDLGPKVNSED